MFRGIVAESRPKSQGEEVYMRALRGCEEKVASGDVGSTANPGTWRVSIVNYSCDTGPHENVSAGGTILFPGRPLQNPLSLDGRGLGRG